MDNAKQFGWKKWSDLCSLQDFIVLDVETTGLSVEKERIIEIAMIRVKDGVIQDRYSSLVFPEKPISSRITKLTGLTNEALQAAPLFQDIAQNVIDFLGDRVVVAHNANFDLNFVSAELNRCGVSKNFTYVDTVSVAKKAFPYLPNYKLATLIAELNLADHQTHRAMDDAECTFALLQVIKQRYGTPLAEAIFACCSPIMNYQISEVQEPLVGKRFVLMGEFTFAYSAAKKLISLAGGSVNTKLSADTDYLLYGFLDPLKYPPEHTELLNSVKTSYNNGGKAKPINEVAMLKLCGVTFYSEVRDCE